MHNEGTAMDRRAFMATSVRGGAAASLAGGVVVAGLAGRAPAVQPAAASGEAVTLKPIKCALKYEMIGPGATVGEKFELIKRLGYDGVEMPAPSDLKPEQVRDEAARVGLEIAGVVDSVHWAKPLSAVSPAVRAEGVRALERAIEDCKAMGGGSVLLVPAVVNKQVSYAEAYERSQAEIRRVVALAQVLGVKISIENVWNNFLLSPLEAARYVDELNEPFAGGGKPPTVGFHFDIGNIVNYGWPEHWIRTLGPRIFRLDVKEFSRGKRDNEGLWKGFNVEIGEGDCDWPEVMKALNEIGYNGWAAAEVGGGDEARLADVLARMRRVLTRGA